MISFRPVTSRVVSRVRASSLVDAAERTVDLSPGVTLPPSRPIMLPDEPGRIKGHHADSDPVRNLALLAGCALEQGPTRMHLLRDVLIAEGTILAAGAYDRIAPGRRRFLLSGTPRDVGEAVLCSTYVNQKYFGHWLKDGLAHEQLAVDEGLGPLVLDGPPWDHEAGYRDLVDLHPLRAGFARCDRLWVLEDHEFNAHFVERYHRIRDRLRACVGASPEPEARVFLARGEKGHGRGLSNRMAIRAELRRRGFIVLVPEETEAAELASIMAGARLIVSPEGSALAHAAIAAPPGAGLLAIIGAQHFNMTYKALSDALGFRFGLTIADPVNDDEFSMPADRLLRAIDLMETALDRAVAA